MPDYPRLRVTAVIMDGDKFFMLEESIKSENDEFFWLFPGGGVEAGETLDQAVLREVKEETGLQAEIIRPLIFVERFRPEINFHTLNFYFLVKKVSGDVVAEDKAKNFGWFSKDEALKLKILNPNTEIIKDYL